MVVEDVTNVMEEAAVSQSEVVSQNIQREHTVFELLTEEQNIMLIKIKAVKEELAKREDIITALRSVPKRKVTEEVEKINKIIEHIPIHNITELNVLFYASALLVTKSLTGCGEMVKNLSEGRQFMERSKQIGANEPERL